MSTLKGDHQTYPVAGDDAKSIRTNPNPLCFFFIAQNSSKRVPKTCLKSMKAKRDLRETTQWTWRPGAHHAKQKLLCVPMNTVLLASTYHIDVFRSRVFLFRYDRLQSSRHAHAKMRSDQHARQPKAFSESQTSTFVPRHHNAPPPPSPTPDTQIEKRRETNNAPASR